MSDGNASWRSERPPNACKASANRGGHSGWIGLLRRGAASPFTGLSTVRRTSAVRLAPPPPALAWGPLCPPLAGYAASDARQVAIKISMRPALTDDRL